MLLATTVATRKKKRPDDGMLSETEKGNIHFMLV